MLLTGPAAASSIFLEPPPSLAYPGQVIVQVQMPRDVEAACGMDQPWGCVTWLTAVDAPEAPPACVLRISLAFPEWDRPRIERNLRARCTGWSP